MSLYVSNLIQAIHSVSSEKGIPLGVLFSILENTMEIIAKKQYGQFNSFKVRIDKKTGDISIYKISKVVSDDEDINLEFNEENKYFDKRYDKYDHNEENISLIHISDARNKNPNVEIDDILMDELPPLNITRSVVQNAKNILFAKIRNFEREREAEDFETRIGEIFTGVIESIMYNKSLIVKLNSGHSAIVPQDQLLFSDNYKVGNKIKACLEGISLDPELPQLTLSRKSNSFLKQLIAAEVPEIYSNTIEIIKIAREEPGSRCKIAVHSKISSISLIGSCVGIKASRINAVSNELNGEKIDFVEWDADRIQFAINALKPIHVQKVILDDEKGVLEIFTSQNDLSAAIGRRGQNIKLISSLIDYPIKIMSEEEMVNSKYEEIIETASYIAKSLYIDLILAQVLVSEGYKKIEDIANSSEKELLKIEGFDAELAKELFFIANEHIKNKSQGANEHQNEFEKEHIAQVEIDKAKMLKSNTRNSKSSEESIFKNKKLFNEMLRNLRKVKIYSLSKLAEFADDELVDILDQSSFKISEEDAKKLITFARNKVYFGAKKDIKSN